MQRWFILPLACVFAIAIASAATAQVIQVEAQPAQVQIQVQGNVQQIQIQPAVADRVAIMPGIGFNQTRMMQADAIFVGRVVAIEPMDVEATPAPNQGKVMYRVAQVQVTEIIHGVKKDTQMVRVAFIAQPNQPQPGGIGGGINPGNIQILPVQPPNGGPAIQPFPGGRRPFPGNVQMQLTVGQDGLFAVGKHHKENFFLSPTNFVQRENNVNFANEVKTAKQIAKAMDNPVAALKAEDKQDRYVAAAILISKYRSNPTGVAMKSEPIDANESKLILQALQGGDWAVGRYNAQVPQPMELFNQLGVTPKEGYNPVNVRNQNDIHAAMQKWLDENNGKFVINRLVADPNAKVQPQLQPGQVDPVAPLPPNVRPPIKINPKIKIQPLPIKGKVQILPAPAPLPVPANPPQVDPAQPQVLPLPARRDQ
jgi:hypothetical protein